MTRSRERHECNCEQPFDASISAINLSDVPTDANELLDDDECVPNFFVKSPSHLERGFTIRLGGHDENSVVGIYRPELHEVLREPGTQLRSGTIRQGHVSKDRLVGATDQRPTPIAFSLLSNPNRFACIPSVRMICSSNKKSRCESEDPQRLK